MKVIRGIPQLPSSVRTAIAIGNFDGIHLGHQALLRSVAERAREAGETPCVLTFEPHPKEFFRPEAAPARILTLRDKASAIASCGIEALFIAPFNRDLAGMPAESFVRDILKGRLRASFVAVGTNFTFGAGPADSAELVRLGAKHGIRICAEKLVEENDACVSSTRLREVLSRGDLEEAERLLGRPYCMSGRVLHGAEIGRTRSPRSKACSPSWSRGSSRGRRSRGSRASGTVPPSRAASGTRAKRTFLTGQETHTGG